MNSKKIDALKNIAYGLISNTIFQVIIFILSGAGLAFTALMGKLKGNKISFSVLELLLILILCFIGSVSLVLLLQKIKRNKNNINVELSDVSDYYFSEYEKHITIYNNGNGIIIHKFTVIPNDINKLNRIRRKLNIEDGNKLSNFPSLESMMQTKKSERFDKFGFWYYSDNDIISEVKEFYWENSTSKENKKSKNNPKEIRWVFKINKSKLKPKTPYKIVYAISVPGLVALEDGKLNKKLLHDENEDESSSNMNIDHKIQKLKYTISFEDGIDLQTSPECRYIIKEQDESKEVIINGIQEYNLLYNKYIFNIENPLFGSDIKILWKYNSV